MRTVCKLVLSLLVLGACPTWDPPAFAMASRARSTPAPRDRVPAATIADMEEASGHLLHLGTRIAFETERGTFTIVTFPREAPATVEQIVRLARAGFYDGLAVHRIVRRTAIQFGDPKTRSLPAAHPEIGKGGSGKTLPPEFKGQTVRYLSGTVGLSHGKDPNSGDSQIFITTSDAPHLDEGYTVLGQVTSGMDVVRQLSIGDRIVRATIAQEDPGVLATPSPSPSGTAASASPS